MDPSSLIFVVIVAIWAVYLLGHWVRRRDMLATARSVDRFSEAMRVLERRVPQPAAMPRSRSYVVAPSRVPRQKVTARVAFEAERVADAASGAPAAEAAGTRSARPLPQRPSRRPDADAASAAPAAEPAGTRSARPVPQRPSRRPDAAANRARALVLLALLVLAPCGWLLVAATSLPAWVAVVLTVALVAHVAQLRRIAMRRREQERRRTRDARRPRATDRPAQGAATLGGSGTRPAPRQAGPRQHVPSAPVRSEATEDGGRSPASESRSDASSDLASGSATDGSDVGVPGASTASNSENDEGLGATEQSVTVNAHVEPEADSAAAPGDGSAIAAAAGAGWQPVPVPPPTYTLKPKAPAPVHRPVAAPAAADRQPTRPVGSGQASNGASDAAMAADSGFDLDQILERRIAAGG